MPEHEPARGVDGGRPADERTWPSDRPDRRIDDIWLSGGLEATGFAATTSTASDHRGIAVTVAPAPLTDLGPPAGGHGEA